MLTCRSCKTSLVLYSSIAGIESSLKELQGAVDNDQIPETLRNQLNSDIDNGNLSFISLLDENKSPNEYNRSKDESSNSSPFSSPGFFSLQGLSPAAFNQRIQLLNTLMNNIGDLTMLEHPICPRCCHLIATKLERVVVGLAKNLVQSQRIFAELATLIVYTEKGLLDSNNDVNQSYLAPLINSMSILTQTSQMSEGKKESIDSLIKEPLTLLLDLQRQLVGPSDLSLIQDGITKAQHRINEINMLNKQLEILSKQESDALDEILQLENELSCLENESATLDKALIATNRLHNDFFATFADMQYAVRQFTSSQSQLNSQLSHELAHHHTILSLSPLNTLFSIDVTSPLPSISGFRLGRTPDHTVEWYEMEMALGQVALLIETLRSHFRLPRFAGYIVKPLGHRSTIIRRGGANYHQNNNSTATTNNNAGTNSNQSHNQQSSSSSSNNNEYSSNDDVEYPLYYSTSHDTMHTIPSSDILSKQRGFDEGIACLLSCIGQLYDTIALYPSLNHDNFILTPPVIGYKEINGYSTVYIEKISLEIGWTNAMRQILSNLRQLVLYALSRGT